MFDSVRLSAMAIVFAMAVSCVNHNVMSDRQPVCVLTDSEKEAARLTPEVMWKIARVGAGGLAFSPDGKRILHTLTTYDVEANRGTTSVRSVDLEGRTRRISPEGSDCSQACWLPDGRVIFLADGPGGGELWIADGDGSHPRQVPNAEGGIEGFGVDRQGGNIFIVRKVAVERRLSGEIFPDLPLSRARVYDDLMVRHWNYWDTGNYSHIFVGRLTDHGIEDLRDIMPEEPWDAPMAPYFDTGEIAWSHSGALLAYTCKKLTGAEYAVSTDSDIYLYDLTTGLTRNLTLGMPGYDRYPRFSPDDGRIVFTSMARPGNESDKARLMTLDLGGEQTSGDRPAGRMVDLTAGFDHSVSDPHWADDGRIYFLAGIEGTVQLFRADLEAGSLCAESDAAASALPAGQVIHPMTWGDFDQVGYAVHGDQVVVARQSISSPTELYRLSFGGATPGDISGVASPLTTCYNRDLYDHIRMGQVERRWVATTDHKQMLTWVVFPPDFDPSKRYPLLLYCQGGPQSTVSQFWSYRWNLQLMAARGYIVVAPNRRGAPSFGQEWVDQISGDYSGQNIRDLLAAIDDVAREPWADRERMGCVGASYGGYSVFYLAGHHEGRFKAFIAHCGIFDLESMYGQTEELWFVNHDNGGPYWDHGNPTAMRTYANSPHKAVGRWDTPIMIIAGEKDFRVPYLQSLEAFTAARCRGIPARLVVFEDEGHLVLKPQNSLAWNREFFGWLDKYLK